MLNLLLVGASITCTGVYTLTADDVSVTSVTNSAQANIPGVVTSAPVSLTIPATATPAIQVTKIDTTVAPPAAPVPNPPFTQQGDVLTYYYAVQNAGSVGLVNDIEIVDDKIGRFTCTTVDLAVSPANVEYCTRTYIVQQEDVDRGFVTNNATAETTFGTSLVSSAPSAVTVSATQTNELTLSKSVAPAITAVDQVVTYTFSVQNTGRTTVNNITISDPLIPALSCAPIATLAPNATDASCIASYQVTQDDIDRGSITNRATAMGTTLLGALVEDDDEITTPTPVQTPSVSLDKTPSATDFTDVGQDIDFTFTVTNTSLITLNNVTVNDPGLGFNCVIGTMAPGAVDTSCVATLSITQPIIDAGDYVNNAGVTAQSNQPTPVNVSDTATATVNGPLQEPSLTLAKNPMTTDFDAPGDVINYEFAIANTGNVTITGPFSVSDPKITAQGGTVDCGPSPPASLGPNETLVCSGSYVVDLDDINLGRVDNTASTSGSFGATVFNPTGTATVNAVQNPGIETTKTQTVDVTSGLDPAAVDAGDVITYEIVIANTGNVTLNTVSVADDTLTQATGSAPPLTLTSGPDFVSNSGVGGGTPSAQGTLLPGESATFTATYALEQADVDAGGVSNIATGTGTPPDGTPITDPSDPAVTPVTPASGIETTKTQTVDVTSGLDPAAVDAGDVITYEIVIANTGNVTLNTVSVADDTLTQATGSAPPLTLTSGPDFVSNSGVGGGTPSAQGTLLPGESATFTATYALEQADVDAGGVSNIATGTGTPPDGTPITDPSDPAVTPVTPASGIETTKTQTVDVTSGLDPAAVDAGDVITYEIVIANTGNVTLNTVSVADDTLTQATGSAPPLTLTSGPGLCLKLRCGRWNTVCAGNTPAGRKCHIHRNLCAGTGRCGCRWGFQHRNRHRHTARWHTHYRSFRSCGNTGYPCFRH